MKILMLCEFYNETLEYQENLLVKYYRKHGYEVTLITSTYESVFDYYNTKPCQIAILCCPVGPRKFSFLFFYAIAALSCPVTNCFDDMNTSSFFVRQ